MYKSLSLLFCGLLAVNFSIAQETWSLEKCIQYAMDHNIQIQQSELSQENAKYASMQQKAGALPSVNASGSHTYNFGQTIDPFTNQFATTRVRSNNFGVQGSFTVFNGFQRINSIKAAQADLEASKEDTRKMQNDVSLNIANAYLQILFGKELVKIAENQLLLSQQQAERIEQLVEVGQLAQGDLLEIQAQVANEELNLVTAENNLNFASLQLSQLLQLESGKRVDVESPNFGAVTRTLLKGNPESIYGTAIEHMPEVLAQEYRLKSAEKNLASARGSVSPRLTLSAFYGTGYSGNQKVGVGDVAFDTVGIGFAAYQGVFAPVYTVNPSYAEYEEKAFTDQLKDNVNKSISFQLSIPIFNGLSTYTNVQRSKVNVINTKLQLDAVKNNLEQSVVQAYNDALAAYKKYLSSEKAVNSLNISFEYAQARYEENLINNVDYSNAKIRLTNAQSDLVRAKFDFIFKTKILDLYRGEKITLQ